MSTIARPALHTLWQSFLAALLVWWHGAGLLGFHAVHNMGDARRFGLAVVVAAVAALASAAMHTLRQYGPAFITSAAHRDNPAAVADIEAVLDGLVGSNGEPRPRPPRPVSSGPSLS